jgi:TfoX/Sxy family transcriptional regulator of competence genes
MEQVPSNLEKILLAAAPPDIDLQSRPMFGGIGVYADGRMFCSLSNIGLALKIGGEGRDALLKVKGANALQYEPGAPPSKSYVVLPDSLTKDRATLRRWIVRSVEFVKSEPAKKRVPKPGRKKAGAVRSRFRTP